MIGPLNCNFFTAVEIAQKISTVGERSYVFEESIPVGDEYFPEGHIFYYIGHAEGYRDRMADANPESTIKTMGCAMDGDWMNYQGIRDRKAWISDICDGLGGTRIDPE